MKTPKVSSMRECNNMAPKWVSGVGITRARCDARFRASHPDQEECPKCGGRAKLVINADQTVRAYWTGPKTRGSLAMMAMRSNADHVNKLDAIELFAVFTSVKQCPFPLGDGARVYSVIVRQYRAVPPQMADITLGELRRALVVKAGEGFNAPTDSYLRTAVEAKESAQDLADACEAFSNFGACVGNVGEFLTRQTTLPGVE